MKDISILMVEDDEFYASLLKESLKSNGYENITHVSSGITTLLEIFEKGSSPDVVLMDYQLGRLTGLEVMQRIIAYKPDLKIIFITGNKKVDVAIASMKSGAVDFITKDENVIDNLLPALNSIQKEKDYKREHTKIKKFIKSIKRVLLLGS